MPEYYKQHYVPQCYVKSWCDVNDKVLVWNKFDLSLYKHEEPKNVLYEPDYYTKTIDNIVILNEDELKKVFKPLEGCIVMLNGKELKSLQDLKDNYYCFDSWEIFKDGNKLSNQMIEAEIESIRIVTIEKFWGKIETDWSTVKEEIEDKVLNASFPEITEFKKDDLIIFLSTMAWRNKTQFDYIRRLIDDIFLTFNEENEEDRKKIIDFFTKNHMLNEYSHYMESKKNNIMIEENALHKLQYIFFVIKCEKSFITSDDPCFKLIDKEFYNGQYNGLYFPITPKILLGGFRNSGERTGKYLIRKIIDEFTVSEMNRAIMKNAYEYIITDDQPITKYF